MSLPNIDDFIDSPNSLLLSLIGKLTPWQALSELENLIDKLLLSLDSQEYLINNKQAIHKSATIEPNAQLKGSMIIGSNCFIANGSLVRGGVILEANCTIGHCSELKTSILFAGSKLAHLNFVGDSVIGSDVNIEGGAVIANYRNEWLDKEIQIRHKNQRIATGVLKFGALVGDHSRIGANAVIAPGAILSSNTVIGRGAAVDQYQDCNYSVYAKTDLRDSNGFRP